MHSFFRCNLSYMYLKNVSDNMHSYITKQKEMFPYVSFDMIILWYNNRELSLFCRLSLVLSMETRRIPMYRGRTWIVTGGRPGSRDQIKGHVRHRTSQIAHNATGAPWICIHYELTNVYSHNKLKVYITHSPELPAGSDFGVFFTLK